MEPRSNNNEEGEDLNSLNDINITISYDNQEIGDDFFNGDPINNFLENILEQASRRRQQNIMAPNPLLSQLLQTINNLNENNMEIFNENYEDNTQQYDYETVNNDLFFPPVIENVFSVMMGSMLESFIDPINEVIQQSYNEQPDTLVKTDRIIEIEGKNFIELEEEVRKQNKECSICSDNFENESIVSTTSCGHIFHKDCIVEWGKYKTNCPICRESLE